MDVTMLCHIIKKNKYVGEYVDIKVLTGSLYTIIKIIDLGLTIMCIWATNFMFLRSCYPYSGTSVCYAVQIQTWTFMTGILVFGIMIILPFVLYIPLKLMDETC